MQLQVGVAVADADVHDGAAGGALSLGGLCWVGGRAGAGGGGRPGWDFNAENGFWAEAPHLPANPGTTD